MSTLEETLAIAVEHHRAGRWLDAADAYRRSLLIAPDYAEVHYNLANVLQSSGSIDEALVGYQKALELKPNFVEALNNIGSILKVRGQFDAAIIAFQAALRINPDYAEAYNNLASVHQILKQYEAALPFFQKALTIRPEFFEAHFNLGLLHLTQLRFAEAATSFERAVQICPTNADAHFRLGDTYQEIGNLSAALTSYRHAIQLRSDFADAYHNLGTVYQKLGQFEAASESYRRTILLRPDLPSARNNLGNVLMRQGRLEAAVETFQEALRIAPHLVVGYNNLASAYKDLRRYSQAEATYLQAIALNPHYAEAHANLANLYLELERFDEAIAYYRKAIELKPDFDQAASILVNQLQQVCDWRGMDALVQRLIDSVDRNQSGHGIAPFPFLGLATPTTPEQQLKCAQNWAKFYESPDAPVYRLENSIALKQRDPRLRIGYLSSDFRKHAVAFMIPELFEEHDRTQFVIFAYSTGQDDGSSIRKRIVAGVDVFREIQSMPFKDAANGIAADGIDILIDLQGYTTHCRTEIVAMRPTPIQVSYLGFPGTMGAKFIDYILADDYVLPIDQQAYYTEKIVHLPGCYQVNDSRHEIASSTPTRGECGLPENSFVFCSFNNCYKIVPTMFDVWMRLMKAVPESVLWIPERNPTTTHNLRREAFARDVDPERLVFAKQQPIAAHLARHRLADLFLDSFPYNAHATASIALRAGVPMVTLAGQTFASRVAGSLLRAVGLPELIARDFSEYELIAMHLATNQVALSNIRERLLNNLNGCRLYDGRVFARNVEKAYSEMWQIHQSGLPPRFIAVHDDN